MLSWPSVYGIGPELIVMASLLTQLGFLPRGNQTTPLPENRELPHTTMGGKILSTSREIYSYFIAASVAACAIYVVLRVY